MSNKSEKIFELREGYRSLQESKEGQWCIYFCIVLGILSHWIWEVLVSALDKGKFEFGTWVIIVARLGIAIIVGVVSFTGIWKQVQNLDTGLRMWAAFTLGFSLDALTAPVANAIT